VPEVNPALIICDTDATTQLLIAGDISVLRELKRTYKVQPAIVEAVDYELRSPQSLTLRRLLPVYEPQLDKALNTSTIQILDERTLPAYVGNAANAVWRDISIRATKWSLRVQRGEAYSHSAALTLSLPILTHDIRAIRILEKDQEKLTSPLLRAFDLYAFGFQCGCMTERDCDRCRQALQQRNEFIPQAFANRSFQEGLGYFYPRLQCSHIPFVGSATPFDAHDVRLTLRPAQPPPSPEKASGGPVTEAT
jgi:hypothetical protein